MQSLYGAHNWRSSLWPRWEVRSKKGKEEHRKQSTFLPRSPVAAMATQKGKKKGGFRSLGVGGRKKVGRVEGVGRHGEKKVLTRNLSCP